MIFKLGGKLRNKILVMMLSVAIVPLIAIGFLALHTTSTPHKQDVASIEENLINQKAEEIGRFLEEAIGIFELRVGLKEIKDIELVQQRFLLTGFLEEIPELEEIAFISLTGKESTRHSRVFPYGVPSEELEDQKSVEKFLTAVRGERYLGPVNYTLKGPVVTIAAPVSNRNNVVISVLAGDLNLTKLQKLIERSQLGNQGYLYLVDEGGFLIAHSQPKNLTLGSLVGTGFVKNLLGGNQFLGFEKQTRYESFWGKRVVAAGKFLENRRWGLIAEWPLDEADRVIRIIRNQIFVAFLVVLLATILLSIILSNLIVGPIQVLESGTKRVAEGKFDEPVDIKTGDEIEKLGLAFNKMVIGLKQLEELKEEFVFIAAHELRAPVTAIKGYLSLIADSGTEIVSTDIKKYLSEVATANQRLVQLVNDLLEVARSEAGRLAVQLVSMDISPSVKAVLSELKPLADEKKISLVYGPVPNLPKVSADEVRLKEVLINLIGNAIKYTLGSGTVTVSHEVKEKTLITHIKDDGMGIRRDAQAKLFEKFYRVQDPRARNVTGTGLGLFIVKTIVEKMNGQIWVESEENKGSIFSFSLPLA